MTAVKGSKQYRLMVVRYRPIWRWVVGFAVVMVMVAVGWGSYFFGNVGGSRIQEQVIAERDQLRQELQARIAEAEGMSQQVANLSLASEVDKASSEDVRQEVIQLKGEIAALQEDISFYRNLMAPTENERGLTIGTVELMSTSAPRRYEFKVVVQQLATNHELLNGTLTINIIGRENGVARIIPLSELSEQIEAPDIRLRFKYFQSVEGQLELPFSFTPERIELIARSTGRNATEVEKKFGWLVQES
jgi:hypothetical protein